MTPKVEQKPFPFLKLPPELRDQIYTDYVRAAILHLKSKILDPDYNDKTIPILYYVRKRHVLSRNSLALTLVSHQIHDEIQPIIHQNVVPKIQLRDYLPIGRDGTTPGIFATKMGKSCLCLNSRLQRISIQLRA